MIDALEDLINQNYIYTSTYKVETFNKMKWTWGKSDSKKLREKNSEVWNALEKKKRLKMLVIYFDDDYLDLMAENFKVKSRMTNFNVRTQFHAYASEVFLSFDAAT